MRYFLNTSAAKPAAVGGYEIAFELVGLRGGSWLGIVALGEPEATVLASARWPDTDEITEELYQNQKKKLSANQPNSPASPTPTPPGRQVAVADRVGSLMSPVVSDPARVVDHNSTSHITAVSLLTTKNSPPVEPLLAQSLASKRRPF